MIVKQSRKQLARDEKIETYEYVCNVIANSKHVILRQDQTKREEKST